MPESLRARKKRDTENAIEIAAVELALERGHANVTVADICKRADVSRSTFFNYMSSRETALFGRSLHLLPVEQAGLIIEMSADVPLTTAVFRLIIASIGHAQINAVVAEGRNRMLLEQPDTQAAILAPFLSLTTELTAFLVPWLAAHPERRRLADANTSIMREASLTVLVAVSAFQSLISDTTGTGDVEATEAAFRDSVRKLALLADESAH
ncbi:AcrR family transcriptional regulator [Microbacterium sp. SORGH_AS428]|mgnify:CR=1 FL=1|uniref:TetR/AcrR family transcriptional regulator n=1 Tax=Microbacterium sp. SORGH_AS_0428 TaxID=3041788 RepID=UPI002864F5B0|nr:TetR/AcrR family transcriptional regulator [Microbacterium sp. SORGH_AS_0428]MDR6199979.1 AcrR family transcriptional regulator [Microbacterium sp. SORGH_AS_0428]